VPKVFLFTALKVLLFSTLFGTLSQRLGGLAAVFGGVSWVLSLLFLRVLSFSLVEAWVAFRCPLLGGGCLSVLLSLRVLAGGVFGLLLVLFPVRLWWRVSRLPPPRPRLPLRGRVGVVCRWLCVGFPVVVAFLFLVFPFPVRLRLVRLRFRPVRLCCLLPMFGFVVLRVSVVAVAGSRSLPPAFVPLVASVVRSVVAAGHSLSVGCCVGADRVTLSAVPLSAVRCFSAFGAGGVGSCPVSAVSSVSAFAAAGGSVRWWAGGGSSVSLSARLASRTAAVVGAASVSCVVFFSSPRSRGSLLAASLAVGRGLPVYAFACGFCASLLPSLGSGSWVAFGGSGAWSSAWLWSPSQKYIF
jgi:hypothetical protein